MSASIGFPVTAERLLCRALEEARSPALSLGQAAPPWPRRWDGELCGLLVDRREDVTRRPTRDPDAPAEVAVEVWLREVDEQTELLLLGCAAGACSLSLGGPVSATLAREPINHPALELIHAIQCIWAA